MTQPNESEKPYGNPYISKEDFRAQIILSKEFHDLREAIISAAYENIREQHVSNLPEKSRLITSIVRYHTGGMEPVVETANFAFLIGIDGHVANSE